MGGVYTYLVSKGINTYRINVTTSTSIGRNPNTGVAHMVFTQHEGGQQSLQYTSPPVVEISAVETAVTFTEENAVTSITPTSITVVISEGTTSSDQQLTYTVTVNGTPETVTGSTEFVTTFTFPETTSISLLPF